MAPKKTYLLVPNYEDFPIEGPLSLGSIIADPKRPQKSLNPDRGELPAGEKVQDGLPFTDWKSTIERSSKNELGFWAKFVSVASADVNFDKNLSDTDIFEFDSMTSQNFEPSGTYLAEQMKSLEVQRLLKDSVAGEIQPLYMVVGLKIVKGAKITSIVSKEKGRGAELSGDGSPAGIPVGAGAKGKRDKTEKEKIEFKSSEAQVIGFRIRQIKISELSQQPELDEEFEDRGATFGNDDEGEENEKGFDVSGLDEIDALGFSGWRTAEVVEEESGEACNLVYY